MKKVFFLCCALVLWGTVTAQTTITGQITDDEGNPLPGANVVVAETRQGTATDETGLYRIDDVPAGDYTIVASFIGYEPVEMQTVVRAGVERQILHLQLEERIIALEELLVRAIRADDKTPMTFTNIDAEKIEASNLGQDVPFLLRWTPSTVVTSDAGTGIGYTGIRIRGTDPTRINVTINGIPLNDAESQGVFWVDLPDFISSTDDIQIQRGVGTSTNGAGAFGASINLNTLKLEEKPYAEFNGALGSFNTQKRNIQFGSGLLNNKFIIEGRLSRIDSDGFIDRGSADLESYFLSAVYKGKNSRLQFNLFSGHEITYQAWNGVPEELLETDRTFNSAGTERVGEPYENEVDNYEQTHYQLLYNNQLNLNWNLNLALHYTRGLGFFEQYKASQTLADYGITDIELGSETISTTDLIRRLWLDNDFYGTTYALNYLSDNNKLEANIGGAFNIYEGGHFGEVIWARSAGDKELGDRYYNNDAEKTDFNIFTKFNYELLYGLNAFIDLQYRRVSYEFLNGLENEIQTDQLNFFNPKFGVFYQLKPKTNVYASFAVANREPNRNDYVQNRLSTRPRPERLLNTEVGLRKNWDKAGVGFNIYHMAYQDQLALDGQLNEVGEALRINIDKSYRLGLEVVGGIELSKALSINANATVSRNRVDAFTEFVDTYDADFNWVSQTPVTHTDTDLAFSPELIAGTDVSYEFLTKEKNQSLSLSFLSKYVSQQYVDNTSDESNVLDAYFFSDFRLRYVVQTKFFKEIGVSILARNIFDAEFETNAWSYRYIVGEDTLVSRGFYPQAGRNILIGLNVKF